HFEAKGLCRLKIDNQYVFGGCLYREIGRFLSLENAIHIPSSEPLGCNGVRSVGNKTTAIYGRPVRVNGRQPVPPCQFDDEIEMRVHCGGHGGDEARFWRTRDPDNPALQI